MWYNTNEVERIQIELTNYCNAACPECEREQILRPSEYYIGGGKFATKDEWIADQKEIQMFKEINDRYLTLEQIKKRFKPGDWSDLRAIHFCGNIDEPTINPEFMDITNHFLTLNNDTCVFLSTNGGTRNTKFWKELGELSYELRPIAKRFKFLYETLSVFPYADNGEDSIYLKHYPNQQAKFHHDHLDSIVMAYGGIIDFHDREIKYKPNGELYYEVHGVQTWFGIDGLEDTNHIYRRGVKWERLQNNFREYIKAGGNAGWQFIVFPWNVHQIEEARQRSLDEGFTAFSIVQTVRNGGNSIEGGVDNPIINVADLNLNQDGVTGGRLKDEY